MPRYTSRNPYGASPRRPAAPRATRPAAPRPLREPGREPQPARDPGYEPRSSREPGRTPGRGYRPDRDRQQQRPYAHAARRQAPASDQRRYRGDAGLDLPTGRGPRYVHGGPQPRRNRHGHPVRPRTAPLPRVLAVVLVLLVLIIGVHAWLTRTVQVTVNGQPVKLRIGSTMDEVVSASGATPAPGDLVSVSGNTLEDGQGYAYTASLDGNQMDEDAAKAYRASEGDDLDISDGGDRIEDYDVQTVQEAPKLEMGGDAWGNITYVSQWPKAGSYEMRTGRVSGETARGDTIEETQNAVVTIHQIKPSDGRKLVALTFDDGPAEKYTEAYLDILNQYGIHATFFNLGQNVKEYPDLSKKIVEQGSEVMSHTYQHQQLSKLGAEDLKKEFSDAFSQIQETTGVQTTGFRPPYGDFTEKAWLNSGGLASVSVLWNQDSEDWRRPGVDAIVANSEKGITSGSIILMHDGGGPRDQDIEALPRIIEDLQAQGYEFVTVSELMQSDDSIPEDIAAGNAAMPEDSTWPTEIAKG